MPEFSGVFLSKLYKFTYNAVAPYFGEPQKSLTDLTLIRGADVTPILLGSALINGNVKTQTRFGFSALKLDAVKIPPNVETGQVLADHEVQWSQAGQTYRAKMRIVADKTAHDLVPKGDGPKYNELWQDGKLTGVVLAGSNLSASEAGVMDHYITYYKEQGFTFPETAKELSDIRSFLGKGIKAGEFDFFIKEAHSDGDEKNVCRLDKAGRLLTGVRKLQNGKEEVVHLIFSDRKANHSSEDTELLPNEVFGEWLRDRERQGFGQFVYFNTSC